MEKYTGGWTDGPLGAGAACPERADRLLAAGYGNGVCAVGACV